MTMLVAVCQPNYSKRIDVAFRDLMKELKSRLENSKIIRNLAHPEEPMITRTPSDDNVIQLQGKVGNALTWLEILDEEDCTLDDARKAWDRVFKSAGYFEEKDDEDKTKKAAGITSATPRRAVDHSGGGRFG